MHPLTGKIGEKQVKNFGSVGINVHIYIIYIIYIYSQYYIIIMVTRFLDNIHGMILFWPCVKMFWRFQNFFYGRQIKKKNSVFDSIVLIFFFLIIELLTSMYFGMFGS